MLGLELLRARLEGLEKAALFKAADKSQSLPDEERTFVGLISPPSWRQRGRRTEKAVLGCVCVLELAQALPLRGRSGCWARAGQLKHPKRNCLSWKGLLKNHPAHVQSSLKKALRSFNRRNQNITDLVFVNVFCQ